MIPTDETPFFIPLLPMRDIVIYPKTTYPIFIGRDSSIRSLERALADDRLIMVVAQRDKETESPEQDDLYDVGTVGKIVQVVKISSTSFKVLFEGMFRANLKQIEHDEDAGYSALVSRLAPTPLEHEDLSQGEDPVRMLHYLVAEIRQKLKKLPYNNDGIAEILEQEFSPDELIDRAATAIKISLDSKQKLLEESNTLRRAELLYVLVLKEVEQKRIETKLRERIKKQVGKTQREYYLNEQLKAIQSELGRNTDDDEAALLTEQVEQSPMPQKVKAVCEKEIKRLSMMHPTSAESGVVRTYLDWLLSLPWQNTTEDNYDLHAVQKQLDADHYGLEKVKERIVEYVAVAKQVGALKGPIICLTGPPGVGKTSLAKSIADALGRKFERLSLGGIRDEAEIRGHRRTYIGAMPGRIIQSMKKAESDNPVILLDEIDKLVQGHMGNPAAALLEVLDPEQNHTFTDHYLEVDYDLSQVLFLCTSNTEERIPHALHDRMEVIRLSGYTELEKSEILRRHLLPKQRQAHGLSKSAFRLSRERGQELIQRYTREAGIRELERTLAKLCRKAVTEIQKKPQAESISITGKRLLTYLGPPVYNTQQTEESNTVGVVNGLSWSAAGGAILQIEAMTMPGSKRVQLTGKLGEVMQESARIASSFLKANANQLGVYTDSFDNIDFHVHVPEGAVPKDGPSAGVALLIALLSATSHNPVRCDVAMTGEVTLTGKVLAIGGLKEKLLAATRGNIQTVIIPAENKKDLIEIPKEIQDALKIISVKHVREAIDIALAQPIIAVDDADKMPQDENNAADYDEEIISSLEHGVDEPGVGDIGHFSN